LGMTIAQKILASHAGKQSVSVGEFVTAKIDVAWGGLAEYNRLIIDGGYKEGLKKVFDPTKVFSISDHDAPPTNVRGATGVYNAKRLAAKYGITYYDCIGVQHQIMPEHGNIRPGMLGVGQDSHSVTGGAFNAATNGIGPNEMAYVFALGELWFRVPATIKFDVTGKLQEGVMTKDIVLHIAAKYGLEVAQYKSIEWGGSVIEDSSIDGRMTMSNQSVEIGAKYCIFEADKKCVDWVKEHTDKPFTPVKADADAVYEQEYTIDGSALEPLVAFPHSYELGQPISKAEGIEIDQAVIGSCAQGRVEDFAIAAKILKGKKVNPKVRAVVEPASYEVLKKAADAGIISTLIDAGVIIEDSCCGVCTGYRNVLAPGEVCIAATTRNFQGRMGSTEAKIYLANPAVVAASALTGKITDPRRML
jgi:3-isopropylmalate/(R)-2-methylmalate dehydratase large subunit